MSLRELGTSAFCGDDSHRLQGIPLTVDVVADCILKVGRL